MLRWGCLLLLHPAFARASYSYSYVSTVDEPVGKKKNSTARGKKYRGFESFKYPPREDPDVTVCKEIKQLTTDCMRAYNCTGDDDKYWNGECEFKCDGVYGAAASRARGRFAALGSLLLVLLLR